MWALSNLVAILLLSVALPLRAQPAFTPQAPIDRLDTVVQVFIDTTGELSINNVSAPEFQSLFITRGNLVFGYRKDPIWLKLVVRNPDPKKEWLLEIPAPFLEYVDFYQRSEDNGWQHSQAGYYRPQHVRLISHTGHVLPLTFGGDGLTTVFIQITGQSPKTFPVFVMDKEYFHQKVRYEDVGYGIFFGILIVMFCFNLFIYLALRQTNYLLYIATIVCTFLIFSGASGYGGKFLWPNSPAMNFYAGRLPLGILTIFLSIFTIRFLEVRRYSKVMYYALLSLIPLGVLAVVLVATNIMSSAGNNLIALAIIVYITCGIVCRIRGNLTATYFIAAWTIYFTGGLLLTLRNSGFFDFNFWTTHFVEIGAAAETVIIAFALADRYRRLKKEKESAQQQLINLQHETNEQLEVKVNERTEQLVAANTELQAILETNQLQTQIIADKNAELDAFFYRISHDLKGPISSLLGLSAFARQEVDDGKAREYFDMQYKQTKRLNSIVTGLADLTRLNNTNLRSERINFQKLVDDCIGSLNTLPQFGAIEFRKEIDPNIDYHCEWALMNAIVQNLIENAIKYSRTEDPYVHITITEETNGVNLIVSDNGQGIASEHQTNIFEMFYRASIQSNGSGLGLYILKRSVDRLGGTIHLVSDVGIGSTFTIRFPKG